MFNFRPYIFLSVWLIISFNLLMAQFEELDPGLPEDINAITYCPVDQNTVWIGGGTFDQAVYQGFSRTEDGGQSWKTGIIPAGANFFITNIFALNDSVAWVTMADFQVEPAQGRVYKTTDGGENWVYQTTAFANDSLSNPTSHRSPNFIYFWNENEGVVVGDENNSFFDIYITSDGGDHWTRIPEENIPDDIENQEEFVHSNYWVSGDSIITCGTTRGRVFRSTDRGHTWTVSDPGLGNLVVYAFFQDEMTGYATGPILSRHVAKTTNGGMTWEELPQDLPFNAVVTPVAGSTDTLMFVSGGLGDILQTGLHGYGLSVNGGETWQVMDSLKIGIPIFTDKQNGWAGHTYSNKIYKWMSSPTALPEKVLKASPASFQLAQNFPNPFNPSTVIEYQLNVRARVELTIYNIRGQKISTLVSGEKSAGLHSVTFDGSGLASGEYYYTLRVGKQVSHKKMVLVK